MRKVIEKHFDLITLAVIFLIVGYYVVNCIFSMTTGFPRIRIGSPLHYHMLSDGFFKLLFALVLLWNTRRFKGCIFTWIAVLSFVGVAALEIAYYQIHFPYRWMLIIGSVCLFGGMALMFLAYLLRLCLRRFGTS